MTLISFEDAVTARNLDPHQLHAVYYCDGAFANRTAVAKQCPKAKLYGITVFGRVGPGVFACDCERGDLTVSQALAWTEAQMRLGVKLICVYSSLSVWVSEGLLAGVQALERKHGVRVRKWNADYNNIARIPAWADADQYANPGPVDRNVALANFFGDVTPVVPPKPHGHARFEGTVDLATGKIQSLHGLPGLGVHFAGPEKWLDVHIQLQVGAGGGHWRQKP